MNNSDILNFAKNLATFSSSAERSNGIVSQLKLNKEQEFELRLNIEIFITEAIVYFFSSISGPRVDQVKKDLFLSEFEKSEARILKLVGHWPKEMIDNYVILVNNFGKLFFASLQGKTMPEQEDFNNLWDNLTKIIAAELDLGREKEEDINKAIKLKISTLHYETLKLISENLNLFFTA